MRLLKIGRDATCDIVMQSDKVSALHAELTLLNSGDIMLEDKGSHNGTYIMNQRIKPNKPVNVRRGDAIRFADVELQWSQVPMPEDNSAYQGVYGIGSHFNNDFQIAGATVSRYHATVKHGRDGKMYIIDHSKNGTTVNGTKIPSNMPYRIKRNSAVVCGGVPVDLSRLPWPSQAWKYVLGIAASLLIVAGIGLGIWKLWPQGNKTYNDAELYAMYNKSVVLLIGQYHYEVTAGNLDPAILELARVPTKFKWHNGLVTPDDEIYPKLFSQATGFFVSKEGHIVTNLHVVKPWLFSDEQSQLEDACKQIFHRFATEHDLGVVLSGDGVMLDSYTAQIKVVGVLDNLFMVPNGKIFSVENAETCRVLSAGEDKNTDVALVQTEKGELPSHIRFINVTDSMDISNEALTVGYHMWTIGFPRYSDLPESENAVQAQARGGSITASDLEFLFGFDAASEHGASGSPIFNDHGALIGVLSSGLSGTQGFNFGIKAKYVKNLLESPYRK